MAPTKVEPSHNPTCILTGRKDNLVMRPHRNEKGDMVVWIFVHEVFQNMELPLLRLEKFK